MTAEAKARFKEGLDFYKSHKNVEARTKYLQALALSQSAAIYLNLAVVEYDLLMYPDALRHAKSYVVHPKAEPAKVEKLKREMIPDLESKTAHLSVEGQAGVAVFVDGEKVGVAPIADQVHVGPGEHTVACGAVTKTVVVKAGDTATVIVVIKEPAVAPPASASASVAPSASASAAPAPAASSSAVPQNPPPVEPPKEGRSTAGWVVPISLAAVGLGAGVVGGVFLGKSGDDKSRAQKAFSDPAAARCAGVTTGPCLDGRNALVAMHSDNDTGIAMLIVGGGLVVGAVVTYILWPTPSARRTAVGPYFDGQGGGFSAAGSF